MEKQIDFKLETVAVTELRPHPQNYRSHPEDQLVHIIESIKEHGFYRNIVIARDGTILAGHGVVEAVRKMGLEYVPVIRLNVDPGEPRALKVLTGDNEISHLGEVDDRALSEMLKIIKEADEVGLVGTGYDEAMLANLIYVTRPESEVKDFDEAAHWVGMPEYQEGEKTIKIVVNFRSMEDRAEFLNILGINGLSDSAKTTWWPFKDRNDRKALQFVG